MNLKDIRYGIEIETVKRTREQVAWAIHSVVGGTVVRTHAGLDPWEVRDLTGRTWKVVSDASLSSVPEHLRAEVVSPVLTYDDLPQLQEVVRAIRRAGAKVNAQCGIHQPGQAGLQAGAPDPARPGGEPTAPGPLHPPNQR